MSNPVPDANLLVSAIRLHLIPENATGNASVTMSFVNGRYLGLRLAHPEGGAPVGHVAAQIRSTPDGRQSIVFDMTKGEQNLVEVLVEGERTNPGQPFLQVKLQASDGDCIVRIFSPGFSSDQRPLASGQSRTYTFRLAPVEVSSP
jgi:hypothetical protein